MSEANESTQRAAVGDRNKKAEQGFGHWKLESAITKRPRKVVIRWKTVQTTSPSTPSSTTSSSAHLPAIAPSPSTSSWVFVDSPSASPVCENKKRTSKSSTSKPRRNATATLELEEGQTQTTLPSAPCYYPSSSPSSSSPSPQTCSPFFLSPPAFQKLPVCPSSSSSPPPPPFFSLPEAVLLQPPTSSYEAPASALAPENATNAVQEEQLYEELDTGSYFDASPSDFLDHELSSVASSSTSFSSSSPCSAGQTMSSESLSNISYTTDSPFVYPRLDDSNSNPPPPHHLLAAPTSSTLFFDSELSFTIPFDFHFPPLCATPPATPGFGLFLTPLYF